MDARAEAFYFAVKRELNAEIGPPGTHLEQKNGYVAFDTCSDWGRTVENRPADMMVELAASVITVRNALVELFEEQSWRNELVEAEERLIGLAHSGANIAGDIEMMEYRFAHFANMALRQYNDEVFFVSPDAEECGDGPTVSVRFTAPEGRRVQYMGATVFQVCEASVTVPPGYCDWLDYTGGDVHVFGDLRVRLFGSAMVPLSVTARESGQVIQVAE